MGAADGQAVPGAADLIGAIESEELAGDGELERGKGDAGGM
jgi:hypothetical protein